MLLVFALASSGCAGPKTGQPCVTNSDCTEGLACGPMETCEEKRMIRGCRMTAKCRDFGYCLAHEGNCRATDASCKASLYCRRAGYCSVQEGGLGCRVGSDADCTNAVVCTMGGKCSEYHGRCEMPAPGSEEAAD